MSNVESLSTLTIHLDRIRWNYLSLQKRLNKGVDCAAVVKANSYGLGADKIVPELYHANCRHFYVAHGVEGVAVRHTLRQFAHQPRRPDQPAKEVSVTDDGIGDAHIYVLNGMAGITTADILEYQLTPVLNTLEDIETWVSAAKNLNKRLSAVIHLDTGMNRLGLSSADVAVLQHKKDQLRMLDLRFIMSHLACADEQAHPKNQEQLSKFQHLTAALNLPCPLSLANSSGIFLGTDYHFDHVRPGCALYGINPIEGATNPMQNVLTLSARILQIRDVAAGETIGYGASYKVSSSQKIAIISYGYADGYLRQLSNSGSVVIKGKLCEIVGRVSMDLVMVDVTAVAVEVGDFAELIGDQLPVDTVAAAAKTIGYEILTALGNRSTKIYLGQA